MRPNVRWMALLVGAGVAIPVGIILTRHRPAAPRPPTTRPTPVAATRPTTRPARRKPPVFTSYLDAVRSANPLVAATQPLGIPVDLPDAAHVVLRDPVYVDPAGYLWVTRPDGRPTADLLAHLGDPVADDAGDGLEFVVRDRPLFAHWYQDDVGRSTAAVVVRAATGGYDLVTAHDRRHLAGDRPYRWAAAYSVPALGKFVVPTDVGVSVFDVVPTPAEHYHALPGCSPATNPPTTVLDARGVLAWAPWEGGKPGSAGVARFLDGRWADLPAADWPAKPIQLSVLLDGSVLRIAVADVPTAAVPSDEFDPTTAPTTGPTTGPAIAAPVAPPAVSDRVSLTIGQLDPATVDRPHVEALVTQLSDADPDQRRAAFEELSRYGPALWPVLDQLVAAQPPEGQVRIRQLLRGKVAPGLAGLVLLEDRLAVVRRQADGTCIVYAPAGVHIPTDQPENDPTVSPAWMAIRPDGHVDRPLSPALVADQLPDRCTLRTVGDEWLVLDPAGPRRFFGNVLVPMLAPDEQRFTELVALAARHRWVFRDPASGQTLVVDPTIANPAPRLPTWTLDVTGGTVGWDDKDNPAVERPLPPPGAGGLAAAGGAPGVVVPPAPVGPPPVAPVGRFALGADGWLALAATDALHTELPPPPPATRPATGPTTAPADVGPPLLRTPDGTRYFDGRQAIVTVTADGHRRRWPLPPVATGSPATDPVLLRTDDGLLFLYNAPGRLLRFRPAPAGSDPFVLEATFTNGIPDETHPARVWLDPAGRIDFAYAGHALTITFPAGRVPRSIADMMPGDPK